MNDVTGIKELLAAADLVAESTQEITAAQPSDMDKLMSFGMRTLKKKTEEHIALTSTYARQRMELEDDYRVRIERLRIEAEDQRIEGENKLRALDRVHADKMREIEAIIVPLKVLRDGH